MTRDLGSDGMIDESAGSQPDKDEPLIHDIETAIRRAFPQVSVGVERVRETEEDRIVRAVMEGPEDPTVRVRLTMPVPLEYVSIQLTVSGDENNGDD